HAITASYGGDATHESSSGATAAAVTVTKHPTTTSVNCSPATFLAGASASYTATLPDRFEVASPTTPAGTVSFFADAATTAFASCTLSGTRRPPSSSLFPYPTLFRSHAITASYGGDATHESSSGATAAAVTVTKHPTTTSVNCSPATFLAG